MRKLVLLSVCLLALRLLLVAEEKTDPTSIVRAARGQIGKTVRYDPSYQTIDYPQGDVPIEEGVCSDVVVRALRTSLGLDLQELVHEDMKLHFSSYPQRWGLKRPDKNIDHRRVPNLQTYFKRRGYERPVSKQAKDYQAGDLVTCLVPPNLPHIMIVSDHTNTIGRPFVIHNIGAGTREEDRLFEFEITGHYRITQANPGAAPNRRPAKPPESPERGRPRSTACPQSPVSRDRFSSSAPADATASSSA